MKVEITKAPDLADALRRLEAVSKEHPREPLILTVHDQPVGAYVPLAGVDDESLRVSLSPAFRAITARSRAQHRAGQAESLDAVQRELGITEEELAEAMRHV
ncbi:MAG: hypothetical protein HY332_05540 [Chloroflexi bacterium]|nr:hypothetical protein [Chloroflexota bacterium]